MNTRFLAMGQNEYRPPHFKYRVGHIEYIVFRCAPFRLLNMFDSP